MDMEKIKAMLEWSVPRSLRELREFLSLTGYYQKFVAGYAQIAKPLTEQLRKDSYGWTEQATQAFQRLQGVMAAAPVLAMPNLSQPFVVKTDASGYGLGALLMQNGQPIAYYSKLLGVQAQDKSIYEKELMAICLAIVRWKHYLMGRHFIVRTVSRACGI